jgi:Flp pilus assembly protein TadD
MTAAAPAPGPGADRGRLVAAVAAQPDNPQLRRALAASLARNGEPRAALDQYRAVLALTPNDADAAADAGLMARRCALEEEVLPLVRAAAAANPHHPRLWQVLGLMHRALDDLAAATAALDRAAELAPRDPLIAHGRARTWLESGRPAAATFERARQLSRGDQVVAIGLFEALVAEQRASDAVAFATAELHRHPEWIGLHTNLSQHLWSIGEKKGFTSSVEIALQAAPENLALWRELITLRRQAGLHDAALAAIVAARAAAGPHVMFDANEALIRAERGEAHEAERLFANSPLSDPPLALHYVAFLLKRGRPDEAERIASKMMLTAAGMAFWPYLSAAWRMTGDPRWQWLEGDPRLVGVYDIASELPPLDALADCLRALHRTVYQPLEQSVRGGTQTEGLLFTRLEPEIRSLRAAVLEAVRAHVAQLPAGEPDHPVLGRPRTPIRFTGSWSVRLTAGGSHANHVHPAGWLSSALYIALPEPAARGPEPAGWLVLGEPPSELELDLPPFRLLEPQAGRLVLFPSIMWHGTRPFAQGERLTVAFDVGVPA